MDRDGIAARFGKRLLLCVITVGWAYVLFVPPPRLPTSFANGVYYNTCCGSVTLSNGTGTSKFGSFEYVIEKDKVGPYVLPTDHAVIAAPQGIVVLPRKPDLFIRTDTSTPPQWIDILGPQAEYRLTRQQE